MPGNTSVNYEQVCRAAAGNRVQMVDDVGTTAYVYDDFYRLITVTNPFNSVVGYRYDDAGNRSQLIYPDSREVSYSYDGDNRLVQVDDWNSGATTYQYDGAGRLITTTLPNGVVSVNGYDAAGRLLSLRHEDAGGSLLAEYLYQLDSVGNRVAVTETVRAPDVVETIDAYVEQNGLLVLEAESGTATAAGSHDWQTQTAQAGYEGTGYRRALPDTGARYEETETASSPQLSWPIYNETAGTYSVWVRGMAPDAGGDSLHVGLDGQTPSSAADLTGFTDEWNWSKVTMGEPDASVDLTTTGEHTLEAYMREDGLRVDRMLLVTDTNYIPSGLGPAESPFQTITETIPGGLGTTSIAYQYDSLYRLTDAAYSGAITATFAYDYDSVGNMTAFTETVDAQTTSVTRSFDAANRLQTSTDTAAGTTTYTYDDNGNLTTIYPPGSDAQNPVGALSYAYDQRNLMVNHEMNPDGTAWVLQAEYVYDDSSDRLHQVDYTGATPITTTYTNDVFGLTQVLMADDGTTQVYNLFGLDLISQDSGSELRTLLVDGLGSVRLEMMADVVETATTYSPYGEVLEQTGASGTVYGFTGEQEDSATGLLYLRARYYSPYLNRFLSADTIAPNYRNPQNLHLYAYVNNNPVVYIDPSGHCRGYYDISSGVATDDQECWDFLHDKFCIGGICSAWQERISGFDILPVCSSEPCLYFGEYYWTKSELEVLSNGLFLVHTVLGNAGYDEHSLLGGITFQRTHGVGYSITFPRTFINLSEVNQQTIWHEIGHSISFRNHHAPQDEYFSFAAEFSCTPWYDLNDFCFRDYCHREYPRWQRPYTGDHPEYWADAFSAWVYMKLYGSPPSFWVESPYQPEWKAIWRAVEWSLAVALE